jgi:hypothetical protein
VNFYSCCSSSVQEFIKDTSQLIGEISKTANCDEEWKSLKDELHRFLQIIISDECQCECYKINILRCALIPYIRKMHGQLILNRKRFHQIKMLLRILCSPSSKEDHPSNVLGEIESVVSSVDAEGGWWKSEFASKMRHAVALEWMPIVTDNRLSLFFSTFTYFFHRKGLQNVASKLLFVGLVDLFRSTLFILPVLTLLAEIALIIQKVNSKSGFTPETIIKLIKSSLLLIVATITVRTIGMLPGLGYTTSMFAVVLFVISSVDPLLKLACPFVAPNMAQISLFIHKMESLENQITTSVTSLLDRNHPAAVPLATAAAAAAVFVSDRVEVLPDENVADPTDESPTPAAAVEELHHTVPVGIRKRNVK